MARACRWPALLFAPNLLLAQCSDAGACAAGRITGTTRDRLTFTALEARSGSPDRLTIRTLRAEGQFHLGEGTRVLLTLPFTKVEGPLGQRTGLGDAIGLLDQRLAAGPGWSLAIQVGARFGTGKASGDPALPQRYQTGLGGSDPILGLRGAHGAWSGGLTYQKAAGRNDNPLTRLERGDDALLWLARELAFGGTRLSLKALAIQRLGRSSTIVPGSSPEAFQEVPDSDRLQVNLEGLVVVPLNREWDLQVGAALPFLKRPSNEDGLKRSWTLSAGLAWAF